jgi:hypothetical protein
MNSVDRDQLIQKMQDDILEKKTRVEELLKHEMLDDDGYPTDEALEIIEIWHWNDAKGWFDFIHSIWHLASWGWKEGEAIDEITNKKTWCYYVSTAGWSGNESIIRAMQKNDCMWHMNWVHSRRGGHYIFELREIK